MGRTSSKASGGSRSSINAIDKMYQLQDDKGSNIGRLFDVNGKVFLLRQDGSINQLPTTTTLQGYLDNVKNAGGNTSVISKQQLQQEMTQRKAYRNQVDRILNQAYVSDTHFVRGSRSNRITNRTNRRNSR